MHGDHTCVMLICPGGDGPVALGRDGGWLSRVEFWQSGALKHEQVRHSVSVAKADQGDRMSTEGKNSATHCLNRGNACRNLRQRGFAFCKPLLYRPDFEALHL